MSNKRDPKTGRFVPDYSRELLSVAGIIAYTIIIVFGTIAIVGV